MVHHLKKLVAENAFFAFLTDRTCFERLSQRTGTLAYPVEYTYYTHLVFVSFTTNDFHEYLSGRPAHGNQAKRAGVLQLVPDPPGAAQGGPRLRLRLLPRLLSRPLPRRMPSRRPGP